MKEKRFNIIFLTVFFIIVSFIAFLNIYTDPFNVFGDKFFKWYTYDFTQNPRTAKIEYIKDKNYQNFIVGASGASSIPIKTLKEYTGKDYFNLFSYGADLFVAEKNVEYLLKNYNVKSIIMPLSIPSATKFNEERNSLNYYMNPYVSGESKFNFYGKYLFASPLNGIEKIKNSKKKSYVQESFDVFNIDGSYDKSQRDIEYIGNIETYKNNYGFKKDYFHVEMSHMDEALSAISHIKDLCRKRNVEITFILCSMYDEENKRYDKKEFETYYNKLSAITPFWDFTGTNYEYDPRFFYDPSHFRNALGKMMVERIYGNRKDFGRYIDKVSYPQYGQNKIEEKSFYIFELHHIDEKPSNDYIITKERFENILKFLKTNKIETVSFEDIYNYVNNNGSLPDKFCILTFDDGYKSNYEIAYPMLKKYGFKATIFPIGKTMGMDKYPGTDKKIISHFTIKEAKEMSDIIEFGSHSFWMHQSLRENNVCFRQTAKILKGESEDSYLQAFKEDSRKFKKIYREFSKKEPIVFAYPEGDYDKLSELALEEEGYKISLTSDEGNNTIVKNLPESLKKLRRVNIDDNRDLEELK